MFYGGDPFAKIPPAAPGTHIEYYDTLGIAHDFTDNALLVKKYRKLVYKNHPDKGGDAIVYKKLCAAYEVLSDPDKRKLYDKFGPFRANWPSDFPVSNEVIMNPRPHRFKMKISLERLYHGGAKRFKVTHDVICRVRERKSQRCPLERIVHLSVPSRSIRGGMAALADPMILRRISSFSPALTMVDLADVRHTFTACSACSGQGTQVKLKTVGPVFRQQVQVKCKSCDGEGVAFLPDFALVRLKTTVTAMLPRGLRDGDIVPLAGVMNTRIVQKGLLHSQPATRVVLQPMVLHVGTKPHATFRRKATHLCARIALPLVDALCGASVTLQLLDGRTAVLCVPEGAVVPALGEAVWRVRGLGMPASRPANATAKKQNLLSFGDLFVGFDVMFPTTLRPRQRRLINLALGSSSSDAIFTGTAASEKGAVDLNIAEEDALALRDVGSSAHAGTGRVKPHTSICEGREALALVQAGAPNGTDPDDRRERFELERSSHSFEALSKCGKLQVDGVNMDNEEQATKIPDCKQQ